jgi:hypothetical protein
MQKIYETRMGLNEISPKRCINRIIGLIAFLHCSIYIYFFDLNQMKPFFGKFFLLNGMV